jgi:hypothetical protein
MTLLPIQVKYTAGTHLASAKGMKDRASATSGPQQAAQRLACKIFQCEHHQVAIKELQAAGTGNYLFEARHLAAVASRANMSVDELFQEQFNV